MRSFSDLKKPVNLKEENGGDFGEEIHGISCIKGSQNRERGGLGEWVKDGEEVARNTCRSQLSLKVDFYIGRWEAGTVMGTVSSLLEKWVLQRQQEWGGGRKQIPLCMGIWQRCVWDYRRSEETQNGRGWMNWQDWPVARERTFVIRKPCQWQKQRLPPFNMGWGSAVPAAGTAHAVSCLQSCLQLLKQRLHVEGWQQLPPYPLWRKPEEQAPGFSFQFSCMSTLILCSNSKSCPALFPFSFPLAYRDFGETLILWRNRNDLNIWNKGMKGKL